MPLNQQPPEFIELTSLACRRGASRAGIIWAGDIPVKEELAEYCRPPQCENYGLSKSCPPHVSGPSGFRVLRKNCPYGIVIRIDVPTEILFSDQRTEIMQLLHETVAGVEQHASQMGYARSKAFAGGSCKKIFCRDHPDCRFLSEKKSCRHPQHTRPSMSGFGIDVSALMIAAGWSGKMDTHNQNPDPASMTWVAGLVLIGI